MDELWPACRVVVVGVFVCLRCHAGDDIAAFGIGLVLTLRPQVEKHGAVSVENWFHSDALALIFRVFVVFVDCAQPPCADAAAYSLFKSIVVGFVCYAGLFVCPVKPVTNICQLVVLFAVFAHKIDGNAIVPVLVDYPHHSEHHLVDFKFRFVFVLVGKRPLPLGTGQRIEPAILQALNSFVPQCALNAVKLGKRLRVEVCKSLIR